MDVAYSEQAAVLLKGSFLSESRKLKDGNALTVSTEGIFPVRTYQSFLVGRVTRRLIQLQGQLLETSSMDGVAMGLYQVGIF